MRRPTKSKPAKRTTKAQPKARVSRSEPRIRARKIALEPLGLVGRPFVVIGSSGKITERGIVRGQPVPDMCLCQVLAEPEEPAELYLLELKDMLDDPAGQDSFILFETMDDYERYVGRKNNVASASANGEPTGETGRD